MTGNRVNLMRGPPRNDAIRGSNGRWTIPGRLLYDKRTSEGGTKGGKGVAAPGSGADRPGKAFKLWYILYQYR